MDGTITTHPRSAAMTTHWPRRMALVAATALVLQTAFAGQLVAVDAWTRAAIATLSWGHQALVDMRTFARLAPYYGAALVVLAIGVARRRAVTWAAIAGVVGGLAFGLVLACGVKMVCWRARPVFPVDGVQLDSFPSGHTASIAFCLAAALQLLALRSRRGDWWWWATAVVGGVLTVAVGFVRLYLQRHWATDVSASLLMALAFWGGMSSARTSRVLMVFTLGLGLLVLGGVNTVLPSPESKIQTRPTPRDANARTLRQEKGGARLPESAPLSSPG